MTTAAQRLVALSGLSGVTAAQMLRAIAGVGPGPMTAAQMLMAYSGLASATAERHLMQDHALRAEFVRLSSLAGTLVMLESRI